MRSSSHDRDRERSGLTRLVMSGREQGCVPNKPAFDKYATVKSGGNLLLSGGLLADNLTELVDVYAAPPDWDKYRVPLLGLMVTCLVLNIICILLSLVLGVMTYPSNHVYGANRVVPTSLSSQPPGVATVNMDGKEVSETPAPRTPGRLRILNDAMTVLTGLVFILMAAKNAIRQGRYDVRCALPENRTST